MIISDKMYCPNCGNSIDIEKFCSKCGVELVYVNDSVVTLENYNSVLDVHERIDKFIEVNESTEITIKNDLNNSELFDGLKKSPAAITFLLNDMDETENTLITFRDSIYDILKNSSNMDFIRSMNNVFGDIDIKFNKALQAIDRNLNYISEYKTKINNIKKNPDNDESNIIEPEEFIVQIDDMISNLILSNKELEQNLVNQDSLSELRNDKESRDIFKNTINQTKIETQLFKNQLEEYLKDRTIMDALHAYDEKYGDVEEKITKCIEEIDKSFINMDKFIKIMDNMESTSENKISLNDNRKLDL